MSKIALTPNASGTGIFTVASPNSSTDRTLTLPDETGTVDTLQRSGNVLQVVNFQTGAVATGTTVIPLDDTIPQITEGDEYMTLGITPTSLSSRLLIEVVVNMAPSTASNAIIALFQDATASALAAVKLDSDTLASRIQGFNHYMTAGTTSATTFKVRVGLDRAGTTTFNGATTRELGGVLASSITITEIAV